jgi:CTP synthase (UTP-ammonia lyase)
MSFLHQQIQSFLNLGVCKEYPIMAKPKNPKKNQEAKTATPSSIPQSGVMSTETVSDASSAPTLNTNKASAHESSDELRTSAPKKTTKKPEIVKSESRSNLVPINLEDEIRQLAYLFSERRGFVPGHEAEDWLAAEHEVMQRYHHQQSA